MAVDPGRRWAAAPGGGEAAGGREAAGGTGVLRSGAHGNDR
jgi:hypothetical protein